MTVLLTIAVGFAAGLVTLFLMPRSGVGGWIGDIVLGIVGAMLGTYIVQTYAMGHFLNHLDMLTATIGFGSAISMLILVHWLSRRMPEAPDSDSDDTVMV